MACSYYINGKRFTESEFKQLLYKGLLDQVIINENLHKQFPDFKVNINVVEENLSNRTGDISLKTIEKTDGIVYNLKAKREAFSKGDIVGQDNYVSQQRNILDLKKEVEQQRKKANKNLGKDYRFDPKFKIILATKVKNKIKYGELNPNSEEITAIQKSPTQIIDRMEEGIMYLLVPSSHGYTPLRLKSNFLGQTKLKNSISNSIRKLFEKGIDEETFKTIANQITKVIKQGSIEKTEKGITVKGVKKINPDEAAVLTTETFDFDSVEDMVKFIVGEYNEKGELIGKEKGFLAFIDHYNLNKDETGYKGMSNTFYAENEFIVSDLKTENGNFFHSPSFVVAPFNASKEDVKILEKILSSPSVTETTEDEKELTNNLADQDLGISKGNEAPINDRTLDEVKQMQFFYVSVPNSNRTARVYLEVKDNSLIMGKIEIGVVKTRKNANDVWQPSREATESEAGQIRKVALPKYLEIKAEFGTKEVIQDVPDEDVKDYIFKDSAVKQKIKEVINNKSFIKGQMKDGTLVEVDSGKDFINYVKINEKGEVVKTYERVSEFTGKKAVERDEEGNVTSDWLKTALPLGKKVDILVRDFFDNKLKDLNSYNIVSKEDVDIASDFIKQLEVVKQTMDKRNEKVLANDIVLYNDEIGVAGTVDLLTYDDEGMVRIYDMKTMRGDKVNTNHRSGDNQGKSKYEFPWDNDEVSDRESHTRQLSLYRILLNNTHGLKADTLGIMPIELSYEIGDTSTKELKLLKGIPLEVLDEVENFRLKEEPKSKNPGLTDFINGQKGENLNIGKTKVVDFENRFKQDATKWNRKEELKWLEEKFGKQILEKVKVFRKLKSLEKHLPKKAYEILLESRKNGNFLSGLFTQSMLFMSEKAFEGTTYHEAFHIVFNLGLTLEERLVILNEAVEKYNLSPELSLIDIEEVLADKFMEYVQKAQTNQKVKLPANSKISEFFKSLWEIIKKFFSAKSKFSIDTLFEDIQLGEYANKIQFKDSDIHKINPDNFRKRETGLDLKFEKSAKDYLWYKLYQEIEDFRENNESLKNKSNDQVLAHYIKDGGVNRIFGTLVNKIAADYNTNKRKAGAAENFTKLYNAFTNTGTAIEKKKIRIGEKEINIPYFKEYPPFVVEFNRFLRSKGININLTSLQKSKYTTEETTTLNEDEENVPYEERWQRGYIEINPFTSFTERLRNKLATLHKQAIVNGEYTDVKNIFGITFYNEKEVFNYLLKNITDSYTYEDMENRLYELEGKKPFIKDIINLVESDPGFRTDLFTTLASKTFQKFLMVQEVNGEYRTFYANRNTPQNLVKEHFISNFLVEENNLFKKYTKGVRKGQRNFEEVNIAEVSKQLERLDTLKTESKDSNIKPEVFLEDLLKFLKDNHLNMSKESLEAIWGNSWSNITNLINSTEKIFLELFETKNPFSLLRPDVRNKGDRSVLENFAQAAISGFEQDLIIAHRNGNQKSVYAVQLSNHLSKLISTFKNQEKINNWLDKRKGNDLNLQTKMPFITKDLLNEEGDLTNAANELEMTILDSFIRTGKSRPVPYTKLSAIEKEAVSIGAFFKGASSKKYGYYTLPIPADSSLLPLIKSKKFTFDEIVDRFVTIAQAEQAAITSFRLRKKNSPEDEIFNLENFNEKGSQFNILDFLEGKINANSTTEDIRTNVIEFLTGEYLELQKEKYKEKGIITNYEKGIDGNITFSSRVIPNNLKVSSTEFFKNYLWNSYYMNTQMTTLFANSPAYYKNTEDYSKRFKQIVSGITRTSTESVKKQYRGLILEDDYVATKSNVAKNIIDLVKDSNLDKQTKLEITNIWKTLSESKDSKDLNNITDGTTFISVDRAISELRSLGRLTKQQEEAAERIKKGEDRLEDAGLFPITKPFVFDEYDVNGLIVPIQKKDSQVMLTKAFSNKYPKLKAAYDLLNNENSKIDFISFKSAIKEGALGIGKNEKGEIEYNSLVLNENGEYNLKEDIKEDGSNTILLNQENWGIIQETPEHYIDESTKISSQFINVITSDMDIKGDYNIGGEVLKGNEVLQLFQKLYTKNIISSYEKVEKLFLDEEGEINYPALTNILKEEILKNNEDEQFIEALELVEEDGKLIPALPFWNPSVSYKINSLLNSFFDNRVRKQRIKGGQMINVTSYGIDQDLDFNIDKETGNYNMEALLPWWSKKFFPKDKDGNVNINALPKELKNIISYRVPTEDKYSIFNIKIVGFADQTSGASIILPAEATTIAGLDFDIDKLFLMLPEYTVKNGKAVYKKYIDKNSTSKEVAETIIGSNELFETFLDNIKIPINELAKIKYQKEEAEKEINRALKDKKELRDNIELNNIISSIKIEIAKKKKTKNKEEKRAIQNKIDDLYAQRDELGIEYVDTFIDLAFRNKQKATDSLEKVIKEYLNPSEYEQFNSKATRNNKILEIMIGIMENKHTALSVLNIGNFENLKTQANKIRLLSIPANSSKKLLKLRDQAKKAKGNPKKLKELVKELDENNFNINYPSTQLEIFDRNMTGIDLIGIIANHRSNQAKAQNTDMKLVSPVKFDKKEYIDLFLQNNFDGVRISRGLTTMLAAVVDNVKDPISSFLNMNTYTVDTIAMLSRLGVNENTIFTFINQPVLKELSKKYFNETGSLSEQHELISSTIQNWKNMLADKKIDPKKIEDAKIYNLNLKELENSLDANESEAYYITQYKVLKSFENYFEKAQFLSDITTVSKVDSKGIGPTRGDNYVSMYKQRKLLRKDESKKLITGYEKLFIDKSGETVNATFNEYARLRPMSIFNKIFSSIGEINTTTGEIKYSLLGNIKNYFNDIKQGDIGMNSTDANKIDNSFITYMASTLPFFNHKESKNILKNVPNDLRNYKNKYPGEYENLLGQLYVKDKDKSINGKVRRILYHGTGKDPFERTLMRDDFTNMLRSNNPETKKMALDLIKYSYFSNGYNTGPYSFFNLIPTEFWSDSFARQNTEEGLLSLKGNNFSKGIQLGIETLEKQGFPIKMTPGEDSGYLIKNGPVYNFIKQFVQNYGVNSSLVPSIKLKAELEHTPKQVYTLAKNEVYVFGTDTEGRHNIGTSGIAFIGNKQFDATPKVKGQRGKWAEYGVTGKVTNGSEGAGFGLRIQKSTIEKGKIKSINALNKLEGRERTIVENNFLQDFNTLAKLAEQNPDRRFIVADLGFAKKEIADLIKVIYEDRGTLPLNIVLPLRLDPRINKNRYIKDDVLFINKEYDAQFTIKNQNSDRYPEFVKVRDKKETKLFELFTDSVKGGTINLMYKRIPETGISNFVTEFSYNKEITDPIRNSLEKEESFIGAPPTSDEIIGLTDQSSEKVDGFIGKPPTPEEILGLTANEPVRKDPSKEEADPLGIVDNPNLPSITQEINTTNKKVNTSFDNYIRLSKEKGESYLSSEMWNTLPINVQRDIIIRLEDC